MLAIHLVGEMGDAVPKLLLGPMAPSGRCSTRSPPRKLLSFLGRDVLELVGDKLRQQAALTVDQIAAEGREDRVAEFVHLQPSEKILARESRLLAVLLVDDCEQSFGRVELGAVSSTAALPPRRTTSSASTKISRSRSPHQGRQSLGWSQRIPRAFLAALNSVRATQAYDVSPGRRTRARSHSNSPLTVGTSSG